MILYYRASIAVVILNNEFEWMYEGTAVACLKQFFGINLALIKAQCSDIRTGYVSHTCHVLYHCLTSSGYYRMLSIICLA
jgi:hypothetical protein